VRTGRSSSDDDWRDQFDDEIYYGQGSTGPLVRNLQLRLHQLGSPADLPAKADAPRSALANDDLSEIRRRSRLRRGGSPHLLQPL